MVKALSQQKESIPTMLCSNTTAPNLSSTTIATIRHRRRMQKQSPRCNLLPNRQFRWISKVVVMYYYCIFNTWTTPSSYCSTNHIAGLPTATTTTTTVLAFQSNDSSSIQIKSSPLSTKSRYKLPLIVVHPKNQQSLRFATTRQKIAKSTTTQLYFMGSDNGILGVGGPEVALILLVGYFVLGPSDLYKLVKEIGKFIQNIRTLGTDLTTTFENNMETTLQLEEIRKAQRELNDAFSFRRTINVDANSDAFSVQAGSAQQNVAEAERLAATAVASTTTSSAATTSGAGTDNTTTTNRPAKKIRRRIRKKDEAIQQQQLEPTFPSLSELEEQSNFLSSNVPDLEMPSYTDEEAALIDEEFNKYVMNPLSFEDNNWDTDISTDTNGAAISTSNTTATSIAANKTVAPVTATDPIVQMAEKNRFQQQLSGNWNNQILSAGDALEPMAIVMNKIALLEQEKAASIRRLEEEFAKRTAIEEKYYKEQRQLLEEAARDVQNVAFGLDSKTSV